ncbi:hypothetical protein HYU94_01240 [Candidatus Daviesbacteria bacterium]|nr:hypothetical protein [Candidatus Daviesbacteria bacterium]
MDEFPQTKVTIVSSPKHFKLPVIIVLGLIALLVLDFLALNYLNRRSIDQANLAVPYSLLLNPMVYEWRGSVEGTLIAKTKDSITLKKHGSTMTIPINLPPNGTKFFYQIDATDENNAPTDPMKEVPLEQVSLNRWLVGDFFVYSQNHSIHGSSFLIMAKGYQGR